MFDTLINTIQASPSSRLNKKIAKKEIVRKVQIDRKYPEVYFSDKNS